MWYRPLLLSTHMLGSAYHEALYLNPTARPHAADIDKIGPAPAILHNALGKSTSHSLWKRRNTTRVPHNILDSSSTHTLPS